MCYAYLRDHFGYLAYICVCVLNFFCWDFICRGLMGKRLVIVALADIYMDMVSWISWYESWQKATDSYFNYLPNSLLIDTSHLLAGHMFGYIKIKIKMQHKLGTHPLLSWNQLPPVPLKKKKRTSWWLRHCRHVFESREDSQRGISASLAIIV